MSQNEATIHQFYRAFQQKEFKTMQSCYAENAVFNDEVFKKLNAEKVRAMWEMLLKGGRDLEITYQIGDFEGEKGSADWVATYTFSQTGRKVVNRIHAEFLFKNGKIVEHRDRFNFWKWSRQALGMPGLLLGWSDFLKKQVRQKAAIRLSDFMAAKFLENPK